jgi:hypothetical protein
MVAAVSSSTSEQSPLESRDRPLKPTARPLEPRNTLDRLPEGYGTETSRDSCVAGRIAPGSDRDMVATQVMLRRGVCSGSRRNLDWLTRASYRAR